MRSVIRRAFGATVLLVAFVAVIVSGGPLSAQISPTPVSGPSASGQVTGALTAGSTLTIGIDGTMPDGWEALHVLEASIVSGGQDLDRLRFDIEDNKLTVGDQDLIVGTGTTTTSDHLRVSSAEVVVTTGGANISFQVKAHVVKSIPEGARFLLTVVDDFGASAEITRTLAEPQTGGITWGTVIAAILVALLAGGFVGNVFASRRRPPQRLSIYGSIQQRIEQERAGAQDRVE
jgi:hypothetical protein